jgi:hypothetical protein
MAGYWVCEPLTLPNLFSGKNRINKTNGGGPAPSWEPPGWQSLPEKWIQQSPNEGISAASVCRPLAACVSDMFCNFYLVKYPKIAKDSKTTKAREK